MPAYDRERLLLLLLFFLGGGGVPGSGVREETSTLILHLLVFSIVIVNYLENINNWLIIDVPV